MDGKTWLELNNLTQKKIATQAFNLLLPVAREQMKLYKESVESEEGIDERHILIEQMVKDFWEDSITVFELSRKTGRTRRMIVHPARAAFEKFIKMGYLLSLKNKQKQESCARIDKLMGLKIFAELATQNDDTEMLEAIEAEYKQTKEVDDPEFTDSYSKFKNKGFKDILQMMEALKLHDHYLQYRFLSQEIHGSPYYKRFMGGDTGLTSRSCLMILRCTYEIISMCDVQLFRKIRPGVKSILDKAKSIVPI